MRFPRFLRAAGQNGEPRRSGGKGRWVRRALALLFGSIGLAAVGLAILVQCLDRPWLKRPLQKLVRSSAGVEIDYRAVRIDLLSGAQIDDLTVHSPSEVAPFAPDLARIGRVDARWSPRSLLTGRGPFVTNVAVSDVTLTVVADEFGNTSFDALPPSPPSPAVPLSRQASKFLATTPPVGAVDVGGITLVLVRTEHKQVSERIRLDGISMALATGRAANEAGWRVHAALGSPASPLELKLARIPEGSPEAAAEARLWVTLDATSSTLTAALDLRMVEQTFAANVSADHWLYAEAGLRFDPTAQRTQITLEHIAAGDGAATAEASLEVPDAGDPIVRHAHGDVDIARLLQWVPAGLAPIRAERARVRYQIDSLAIGPAIRLAQGGAVTVDADISNVESTATGSPLRIGSGELSVRARPAEGSGVAARGTLKLAGVLFDSADGSLDADDLAIDFDGRQGVDGVTDGTAGVTFARVERGGASSLVAQNGRMGLHVAGLRPDTAEPLATKGDIGVSIDVASVDVHSPGRRVVIDGLKVHAHTALGGHAPYGFEIDAPADRLRVIGSDGNPLVDAPARMEGRAREIHPDMAHPAASRGVVHARLDVGDTTTSLDATKEDDAVDFSVLGNGRSMKMLRPLLPASMIELPVDRMAYSVRSTGHVERLRGGNPAALQTTELDVERPAFRNVAARSLSLKAKSQGDLLRHTVDLDLRAHALAVDGGSPSDDRLTISASVDRQRPSLTLRVATEGRATTAFSGTLSFDPSLRAVRYDVNGRASGLAPLAPLAATVHGLEGFDLSALEVELTARGALLGVIAGVSRDGTVTFEPRPAVTAAVEGTSELRVSHFHWSKGDTGVLTPVVTWHAEARRSGTRRTLTSRVELGALHFDVGSQDVDINGIRDEATATVSGDLKDPEIELTQHLSIRAIEQAFVPEYPLGDLDLALAAERGPEGVVHISDLRVANALGGTTLSVTGNVDLGEGRRTLSVTTSLTQDLGHLSTIPERFNGRGKVAVEANVISPDLAHYRVRATAKAENVSAALARAGIDVEAANGEVPVTVALHIGENGVELQRSEKRSPYSMLRFADQHPLMSRSGFFSIASLKTPFVSIAPLVGNLEIEQNVVSLRQFEMGVRGGSITGQCGLDWEGAKSTLEIHVRASGVQSSHGEPFDGNIAVVISAADRTIDGRAEILRIGERHLLDLLDLQDPLHVDPAMNRIRGALAFGYPDNLRLVFDHGFASAHLELGGLARLVSIGELRGIPMGPIVDRMLAPMLAGPGAKEAQ
jgi:hypothetical protein